MTPETRVTFHIGLEKTGTDSFQRFCTEQRGALRRHGVLYPTASLAFGEFNHEPLVACYLGYRDPSIRSSGRPHDEVLGSLTAEIGAAGVGGVLLSGEHFSSRFREGEIARLAADFAAFDCRVAVVVRDHRARLFSAYSQSVLAGRSLTLDAYCDEVFHPDNPYLRCAATIEPWRRAFGTERVAVFRHRRGQDIVPVLCAALIGTGLPPPAGVYWENISIGPGATERLRRVNAIVASLPLTSWTRVRSALYEPRRALARWFAKGNPGRGPHPWQLSESNERRLAAIATADDAWLFEHFGIRLSDAPSQSDAINSSTSEK